ncbi:tetratricopeptide repeat protein [Nitrosophilus kaiyonis]|uniref:tetratricopeptide repeat protein n=1 Tax=Nitrosophilus kaiyonis TaxID=2930200 RepID=UPI002490465A|nr:tetratricopeptide repeat protein [Nitrosophilus kaiyonis]
MSRYNYKIVLLFLLFISVLFTGCSIKKLEPKSKQCCPKLFEDEDRYIMTALYFKQIGAYKQSAELFRILYKKTKRLEYKIEEIKNYITLKDYQKAKKEVLKMLKKYPDNVKLLRLASVIYFHLKDIKNAQDYILKAIKIAKKVEDYEFLASLYLMQKKYELALKYFQAAYAIKPDDKIVDQMATIMFLYLDKKNDAIAYLETHSRMYGCSKTVCHKLASFYSVVNDIDGLLSVYKRLYDKYKEDIYANKIVEIYIFNKNYSEAIKFLEKNRTNDELLFELYKYKKMYDKASKIAYSLYIKSGDLNYLAQNAMFEYESAKEKTPELLKDVANKLEKVVAKIKDSLYLNYLGYLYIDHDINIKRGIKLVKEALKQNPESPYYIDSLAWGYYKLKKCKEAFELMKKVVKKLGLKDEEVKLHFEKIKECAKGEK